MNDTPLNEHLEQSIAVVGLSGRFPGARNPDELWRNLRAGVESIRRFSDEELDRAGTPEALRRHPDFVPAGAVLDGVEDFDADFFGFNPREAEILDPQQRIFLEEAWRALEDAACDPARFDGLVGVFAGSTLSTYLLHNLYSNKEAIARIGSFQAGMSNDKDFLATRVSYKLDLRGPSVAVQTACSTSLVAAHLACQSLLAGECDLALAGGVSVVLPQTTGYLYQEGGVASPDGHCRAFDARARGTVSGPGAGVVVLERLKDALERGAPIYAVIRGSAINNDGASKIGFTAPSVDGQAEVIAEALGLARIDPGTLGYVEAHGSGTELGDPIEVEALSQVFRSATDRRGFCGLGSIKTNIGHLDAAAGVAGLVKTVLALHHAELPPSLYFETPNPKIDFENNPFRVLTELVPWQNGDGPRRAAVSSFGLGGTNAHVVLEQTPPRAPSPQPPRPWQLLLLSARSSAALEERSRDLALHLASLNLNEDGDGSVLADVAWTLAEGRQRFEHRRLLVARDLEEAQRILQGGDTRLLPTVHDVRREGKVVFLCSGLGDQYVGMGAGLYLDEPAFRQAFDRCAEILRPLIGEDLREIVFPRGAEAHRLADERGAGLDLRRLVNRGEPEDTDPLELDRTRVAQPAVFALEYALAELWAAWGVAPDALIGYSLGEYVAACRAGVLSLVDALTLVARRAAMIEALPRGAMLAVPLTEEETRSRLGSDLSLSAINGPELMVVAGGEEAVAAFEAELTAEGHPCRRLATSHAFHSHHMDALADPFRELVASFALAPPEIPFLSNVTGRWITSEEAIDPDYWVRHLRQPVRFADGLAELWRDPERLLVEIGPGFGLGSLALQQMPPGGRHTVLPSLRHRHERQADVPFLLQTLGHLWAAGLEIDFSLCFGTGRRRLSLPTYPFERRRFWIEARRETDERPGATERGDRSGKLTDLSSWFHLPTWKLAPPERPRSEPRSFVILPEAAGSLGRLLGERLRSAGHAVTVVEAGDDLGQTLDRTAALDHVVDLRTLTAADGVQGFFDLLALGQILAPRCQHRPAEVTVITHGLAAIERGDSLEPLRATLEGPLRCLPREIPRLRCRALDVDPSDGEVDGEAFVDRLAAELLAPGDNGSIALRGTRRWRQDFEPWPLPPIDTASAGQFEHGGVYLITGGLGGIGSGLAAYIAQRCQAPRLVLLGRTPLPPRSEWAARRDGGDETARRIVAAEDLERAGAEVLLLTADVADEHAVAEAIAEVRRRFGALHGVIHAAGVPGAGLIQLKTDEEARRVMAPKVEGTLALARALRGAEDLRFFALFSSVAALTGAVGQVDYCAANAFLGAFAQAEHLQGGLPAVAIDWGEWQWDAWAHRALAHFGEDVREHFQEMRRRFGISFAEGGEALERALAAGVGEVVVVSRDLKEITAAEHSIADVLEELDQRREVGGRHPRPELPTELVAPRNEVEQHLVDLFQELLGIEPVGVYDNFFQLGGHSLLGTQLIARLEDHFEIDLALPMLFEGPTAADLAVAVELAIIESLDGEGEVELATAASPGGDGEVGES